MAAIQGVSNSDVQEWWEGTDHVLSPLPVFATYPDVSDAARLTYTDAGGSLANLTVPAPQSGIFLADGVTVDPTAIAVLTAACVGNLCSGAGGLVTAFVSGVRVLRPDRN